MSAKRLDGSINCSCMGLTVVRYWVTTESRLRPPLLHVPEDPAENPHVRVRVHKNFDVHQIPQLGFWKMRSPSTIITLAGRTSTVSSVRLWSV